MGAAEQPLAEAPPAGEKPIPIRGTGEEAGEFGWVAWMWQQLWVGVAMLDAGTLLAHAWNLPAVAHSAYLWARAKYLLTATMVAISMIVWALLGSAQRAARARIGRLLSA